jgi:hypothetical protein
MDLWAIKARETAFFFQASWITSVTTKPLVSDRSHEPQQIFDGVQDQSGKAADQ